MSAEPQTGDVVEVEWRDSERVSLGWAPVKRYRKVSKHPSAYRTAGYWLSQPDTPVLVGLSLDPFNGTAAEVMCIPRSAVTSVKVLGRSNKRLRKAFDK